VLLGAGFLFFGALFAKICSVFGVLAWYLFSFVQLQKNVTPNPLALPLILLLPNH
jgi:hypothetical protein